MRWLASRTVPLLLLALFACDQGGPFNPITARIYGTIEGTVTVDGELLAGVELQLEGPEGSTTRSDAQGNYRFKDLRAGPYVVELVDFPDETEFDETRVPTSLAEGRLEAKVNFRGKKKKEASIRVLVTVDSDPLTGVSVDLTGAGTASGTTGSQGTAEFTALLPGSYDITISGFDVETIEFSSVVSSVRARHDRWTEVDFQGSAIPQIPPTPSLTATASGAALVELSWVDLSDKETSYQLDRRVEGGLWSSHALLAADVQTLADSDVLPATTYDYRLRACGDDGCSPDSDVASATTDDVAPAPPTGLGATAEGSDAIRLQWTDASHNEDRFEIERRAPGSTWSALTDLGAGSEEHLDSGLTAASSYDYRARACNAFGCSAWSDGASATTDDLPPSVPSSLGAGATGATTAEIHWTDASDNETGFELERREGDGPWQPVATLPAASSPPAGSPAAAGGLVTHSDDGLSPATDYAYRVRACNDFGCSAWAEAVQITTDDVAPAAPTGLSAVSTSPTLVQLSWTDASSNEDDFNVERRVGAAAWSVIASLPAGTSGYGDSDVTAATTYTYRVRACNGMGCSAYSNESTASTGTTLPDPPTGLTATATGPSTTSLSWTDASTDETHFDVERRHGGGAWTTISTTSADAESYDDSSLDPATAYTYRVRACNLAGCSGYSNESTATTDDVPPSAPTSLSANAAGSNSIDLGWTDNSGNETSFSLERREGGGTWTPLAVLAPNTTSHTDDGLTPSTTYDYRLRACNGVGCSPYAPVASATTGAAGPNLTVGAAHIVQRTQRITGDVELVADLDGYLRVFPQASESNALQPDVRVRFYHSGALVHTETIPAPGGSVPTTLDPSSLANTWNWNVPSWLIQPDLSILVDVDPADLVGESDETDNTFPANGVPLDLDVWDTPLFEVTFVPVRQSVNGRVGNVHAGNMEDFIEDARTVLPMAEDDLELHAEYTTDAPALESGNGNGAWGTILSEMWALRSAEGSSRHYYGVVNPNYGGGVAGMGYIGGPAAIGWDKLPSGAGVATHEWGHNFARRHSPGCGAGGPDASYPYTGGSIGVWGFDLDSGTLKSPSTYYDFMSYCNPTWVSDYVYEKIMEYRGTAGMVLAPAPTQEGLLVWGRVEGGEMVLEPAFPVQAPADLPTSPGPYSLEGRDSDGTTLFAFDFSLVEVGDGNPGDGHFAFIVPLTGAFQASLESLTMAGPSGSQSREVLPGPQLAPGQSPATVSPVDTGTVEVSWNAAAFPMALIRDAASGQVLSFARGGVARVAAPGSELEITLSNGVGGGATFVERWR